MSVTTWAALAALPRSQKDYLVVLTPKLRLLNWTKTGGRVNVYEVSFASLYEVSSDYGSIWRAVNTIKEDSDEYTARASIAAVDAAASSWYHDTSAGKLYVHTSGSTAPSTSQYIVCFFNIHISSGPGKDGKGKIFNNTYYEPLFRANTVPTLDYEQTDILSGGGMKTGSGRLEFNNTRKFWDKIFAIWTWENAPIAVKVGGEDLPLTEYQTVFTGRAQAGVWSDNVMSFEVTNLIDILKRNVPPNPLFGANVAAADRGKVVPFCFGEVSSITPLCSDNSVANAKEYTIADAAYQTLKAIVTVYDGGTPVAGGSYTNDLTNCKFTFSAYTPTGAVTCDVQGAKISDITGESDTTLMTNGADIIRFFLKTVFGLLDAEINTTAFALAKVACTFELGKYLRYRRNASSYFQEIERSTFGNIYIDNDGRWTFVVFAPYAIEDDDVSGEEMSDFKERRGIDKLFNAIKLHYDPQPLERDEGVTEVGSEDTYQGVSVTKIAVRHVYEKTGAYKNIYTWIKGTIDATAHAQRIALMVSARTQEISFTANGLKLFERRPGDLLGITRDRGPRESGSLNDEKFQVLKISKSVALKQCRLICDDLKGLGRTIGFWGGAAAPTWAAATEAEKLMQGFWSNPSGLIDPADETTKDQSVWW